MKKLFFPILFFALIGCVVDALIPVSASAADDIKLPYEKGQEFVVVQGYNSPPTHIKKDLYAIDFSQDGCDAYGKTAVAAEAGKVMLVQQSGYNGGYGTQLLIKNNGNIVSRYAHLIPGTIPIGLNDSVVQGEPIGQIGDTGLVAGMACPIHPGTHIHFAMYGEQSNDSFVPYFPEPISGYLGIQQGHWYLSDNEITAESIGGIGGIIKNFADGLFGESETASINNSSSLTNSSQAATISPDIAVTKTEVSATEKMAATGTPTVGDRVVGGSSGGVSVSLPIAAEPQPQEQNLPSDSSSASVATSTQASSTLSLSTPSSSAPSTIFSGASSSSLPSLTIASLTVAFNSSTLTDDISWQSSPNASGTVSYTVSKNDPANASNSVQLAITTSTMFSYSLSNTDFGSNDSFSVEASDGSESASTVAVATNSIPNWFITLQPIDNANSNGSWYNDNWYNLGTGFYGTIRALTLEGFVDSSDYRNSEVWMDEYNDANYSNLNQSYAISSNAPFTNGLQKITINNLNIFLRPNKYYRLRTYQHEQNVSVILTGSSATGTAMWDEYVYGVGIVRNQYTFSPYLSAVMIPNYPLLALPNAPGSAAVSFDASSSMIDFSWPAATDNDVASDQLTYQVAVATSSDVTDAAWRSVGSGLSASSSVAFGTPYFIGIRTLDGYGNISTPLIVPWSP
jgi:hypothetical protein